jgi:cysteine desulfurase family protein
VSSSNRIYLDNAATSFPKPPAVSRAVADYDDRLGAPAGRGGYSEAVEVTARITKCRQRAADLLGAESADRIVLTFNGTDGLNIALHGLLNGGDHVVTSILEHNSVLRPLRELHDRCGVELTHVAADGSGRVNPDDVRRALRPTTKLVALIHASNVTGVLQPVAEVARIAHDVGALFLVDAAQTAGHIPIDLRELPVDLLACSGHKGLLGPLGTGLLYVRTGIEDRVRSFRQGGTGTQSQDDRQPESLPDKFEAGNLNVPGLLGLEAALAFLQESTVASIAAHEHDLTRQLLDNLAAIRGVQVYGSGAAMDRVGVVSVTADGYDPQELATILEQGWRIQTRAGLHCAPGAHRALGTFATGGTIRFSVGPFTTSEEIMTACVAVRAIVAAE